MSHFHTARLSIGPGTEEDVELVSSTNGLGATEKFLETESERLIKAMNSDCEAALKLINQMADRRNTGDRKIYVAKTYSDDIAGYLAINRSLSATPELQIEIVNHLHGLGYGSELLQAFLEKWSAPEGFEFFACYIRTDNLSSIQLFEKQGAVLLAPASELESILFRTYKLIPKQGGTL